MSQKDDEPSFELFYTNMYRTEPDKGKKIAKTVQLSRTCEEKSACVKLREQKTLETWTSLTVLSCFHL